jgi:hypothetical protein
MVVPNSPRSPGSVAGARRGFLVRAARGATHRPAARFGRDLPLGGLSRSLARPACAPGGRYAAVARCSRSRLRHARARRVRRSFGQGAEHHLSCVSPGPLWLAATAASSSAASEMQAHPASLRSFMSSRAAPRDERPRDVFRGKKPCSQDRAVGCFPARLSYWPYRSRSAAAPNRPPTRQRPRHRAVLQPDRCRISRRT